MNIIIFLSLAFLLHAQQLLDQSLPAGTFKSIKKESRDVPRYYICGAGVWKRTEMIPQPNRCWQHCNRKRKWWGKSYCSWETRCEAVAPVLGWIRTNGIRFKYCHFQSWQQQIELEQAGNWDWQGMQMCPQGQYVFGYRTKLTDRDGLAGLILLCRNIKNSKEISQKLVFDGNGGWKDFISSAFFANAFKAKIHQGYITGLAMEVVGVPYIFAFSFNYQFPKNFNTAPNQIENSIVYNFGIGEMRKEIELSKEREFQRVWQNEKGYLHGISLSQIVSQSISTTMKVGIPFISTTKTSTTQTQTMIQSSREESMQKFKFGTVETFKVGQKQKDIIVVPPCTKYVIKQIVYSSDADVPYVLQLGYTNGAGTEYEAINGFYRGVSTGEVEVSVNYQKIC